MINNIEVKTKPFVSSSGVENSLELKSGFLFFLDQEKKQKTIKASSAFSKPVCFESLMIVSASRIQQSSVTPAHAFSNHAGLNEKPDEAGEPDTNDTLPTYLAL